MLNNIAALMGSPSGAVAGDYESIATVTVGSGGTATITFSSIAADWQHLQVRCMYNTITNPDNIGMTLNGSTTPSHAHYLYGNGTNALAGSTTSNLFTLQAGASGTIMYGMVIDLLDYSDTNKYKTLRSLGGGDFNGSGITWLSSALYATTSAISSFTLQGNGGQLFSEYSSFALYGIK